MAKRVKRGRVASKKKPAPKRRAPTKRAAPRKPLTRTERAKRAQREAAKVKSQRALQRKRSGARKARERKRLEEESIALGEIEADNELRRQQLAARASSDEVDQLVDALETMRDHTASAGATMTLSIENAPVSSKGRAVWLLVGHFSPTEPVTYAELGQVFSAWRDDLFLEAAINPQRLSWIRITYQRYDDDGDPIGGIEGFAVAGAGPWGLVIAENADAVGEPGEDDEDSLASRYANTAIVSVEVSLATDVAKSFFRV